jgi:preprotein translocase subunit YajC
MVIFFIQMAIILMIFYFLILRPRGKEQEHHQQMLQALKKGDEVVTAGGIIGTVVHAEEDRLTIRSAESRLVVERSRIVKVLTQKEPKEQKDKDQKE